MNQFAKFQIDEFLLVLLISFSLLLSQDWWLLLVGLISGMEREINLQQQATQAAHQSMPVPLIGEVAD